MDKHKFHVKIFIAIPVFLLLLFIRNLSFGQTSEMPFQGHEPITFEKIYLHTDREFYFLGETIWFKAYLLDGQSLSPVTDIQNLFIDLIDSKGRVSQNQVLLCENGEASGNILIPDTIETGTFIIRAYTDYLKNFGEEAFFHKPVKISRIKSSIELESEKSVLPGKKHKLDISFFPEGGFLLADIKNLIAFKAIDENGKGLSVNGKVLDNRGNTVTVFKTHYKGMGRMHIHPDKGKSYNVILDGYPNFKYSFSEIRKEGVKLQLLEQSFAELVFGIVTNSSRYSRKQFYLACYTRGELLFYKAIEGNLPMKIVIEADVMQEGINRFILLNEDLEPVSERLVFSDNINVNNLDIETDLDEYTTRSQVELNILDEIDNPGYSHLSVAVVNVNALNANQESQNILSYLLLDSELKGFIESPANYFVDDSISSRAKLNLLMLTHGWSRYIGNSPEGKDLNLKYPKTAGITIKGRSERITGRKDIVNGTVTLGIFENGNINWYEEKTDSAGRFSFDNFFISDTTRIVIQSLNQRGKQKTEILLDNLFDKPPSLASDQLRFMNGFLDMPFQMYRQKYYSDLLLREFNPDQTSILLEEVEIIAEKIEKDDRHFRIYSKADHVLEVTSQNYSHTDVLEFLKGRVPGLVVSQNNIFFLRATSSISRTPTPLFLIDGFPTGGSRAMSDDGIMEESVLSLVRSIPMSNIEKVEILKGSSAAIFGSSGANGVIAIYTRRGSDQEFEEDHLKGIISERIVGYSNNREFYSPEYTPENINSPRPDYRTTLYWDPDITTKYGNAVLSFFTSDEQSYYRIIVEGIMDNGAICIGTASFAVNSRNESLDN